MWFSKVLVFMIFSMRIGSCPYKTWFSTDVSPTMAWLNVAHQLKIASTWTKWQSHQLIRVTNQYRADIGAWSGLAAPRSMLASQTCSFAGCEVSIGLGGTLLLSQFLGDWGQPWIINDSWSFDQFSSSAWLPWDCLLVLTNWSHTGVHHQLGINYRNE